ENSLSGVKDGKILYLFKKSILDEMTNRADEIESHGLKDKKVLSDLVVAEHPDLKAEYKEYYEKSVGKRREKRKIINNIIGSFIYVAALLSIYLIISFATQKWGQTWVLMVGGICLWVSYLLDLIIVKVSKMRRIFHLIARIVLALNVMLLSTTVFILCLAIFHLPHSWLAFIAGVALMFIADAVYVTVTGQKLVLINYLLYIPPVFTMLYVILGAVSAVEWNKGWMLVPVAVLIDVLISAVSLIINEKKKTEAENEWKEN
ncbi:MAG: hypothetical protein LIO43_03785, partial [Clostridiales bacterium]|nr:hypothetical protein [Clostridiales bacterium]